LETCPDVLRSLEVQLFALRTELAAL
jgi:hypothetical protein